MAKTAREEGFAEIAEWFEALAKAERSHASRFRRGASPGDKADMTLFFGLAS
jgi:rubrerythrin